MECKNEIEKERVKRMRKGKDERHVTEGQTNGMIKHTLDSAGGYPLVQ